MSIMRQAAAAVLHPLRSRGRTVAWTPEFMGLGNLFQLAMWAHQGSVEGERRWIRSTDRLTPWLSVFPGLRRIVLMPDEVRFTDRRVAPWREEARAAGTDEAVPLHEPVDIQAVERFLRDVVLPGSSLPAIPPSEGLMVVNVRRGDYFSDPEIRSQYGFDVRSYLQVAVHDSVARDGAPRAISVVSDDMDWCRDELPWLQDFAPTTFPASGGAAEDFAVVSSARRLVITNSTFSYWAAHLSNLVHGDNHAEVWAPRFFDRTQNDGDSWLLDERWSIVEDLPGGWELPVDEGRS